MKKKPAHRIVESEIPWLLTINEVDRLNNLTAALTAALELLGESEDGLCLLLTPHIDDLKAIKESLSERAEKIFEAKKSAA